ncbi:MAG: VanZ family protein [Candidatus Hydrogenedentes bacterium]|nr:VanZ family protein [Candidatus Hydrogenedentota bacterium]
MKPHFVMLTIAYCAGIFWLSSSVSPVNATPQFPQEDKLAHIVLYGGLAAVVSVGIRRSDKPASFRKQFWAPVVFASLYGMSDEFHQLFGPGRYCELGDMLADATGALLAQLVLCYAIWRLNRGREAS